MDYDTRAAFSFLFCFFIFLFFRSLETMRAGEGG